MISPKKTGLCLFLSSIAFIIAISVILSTVIGNETSFDEFSTLKQVNIIFRHGAKYPDKLYNMQSQDNSSAILPASLSLEGMKQLYSLGEIMKKRYDRILPQSGLYSRTNIEVKSSISDRAITSALSFLAAFMPPKINYSPFENLQWQPVPVFNIPRETDTIIIQRRDCPRYDIEKEKQLNSDEIRKHEEANFEFYEYLSFHTSENISSFAEAEYLHNSLDAMDKAGWTLPEWTKSVYPEKTREVCARYLRFLTESDFMKKARGGPLLTEIMNSMMGKSQNLNEKSIAIYSGHDVTLVNIMNTLNILNQTDQVPKFSASLVIELHEKSAVEEEMTVRVFYFKNEQDANPTRVQISGCDSPCYLSTFKNIYKDFLVSDFDEMCKI